MPIYEYKAKQSELGCPTCRPGFEVMQKMSDPKIETCPQCGRPVARIFSVPAVGASKTGFDQRAKSAGFHKLQRLGKGEYEKKY